MGKIFPNIGVRTETVSFFQSHLGSYGSEFENHVSTATYQIWSSWLLATSPEDILTNVSQNGKNTKKNKGAQTTLEGFPDLNQCFEV